MRSGRCHAKMPGVLNLAAVRDCCIVLGILIVGPMSSRAGEIGGQRRQDAMAKWNSPLLFARRAAVADGSNQYLGAAPGIRASFQKERIAFRVPGSAFQLQFLGCSNQAEPRGEDPQPTRVNYLIGNQPQEWGLDLPTYQKIVYRGIYPGVDVQFSFAGTHMKSEFVAAPGVDPTLIRFRYAGLGSPHLDQQGGVTFELERGAFREEAPDVYQWKQGARVHVSARFVLAEDGAISFELGGFDHAIPLVIDPVVIYSTYLGGGPGDTAATAIAADSSGNAYVTGWTDSPDFPLKGPVEGANAGSVSAFVVKLNAAGNTLLYATYIGGASDNRGYGIAIDGAGEAYVTGSTTSINFPTLSAYQPGLRGSKNAFAFKLNAAGNGLIFATYLGGSGQDNGNAIAVDNQGNAYVTGDTTSPNFPTLGPVQATGGGGKDAFVTELSATGKLVYSTYLGGNGDDSGAAIAVDATRSAYVTGGTFSTNFPTAHPLQAASGGGQDCFITKLAAGGASLVYSTYLGGSGGALGSPEAGAGIAVDSSGDAYVAGSTSSSNFPVSVGFQLVAGAGTESAFVSKLNPAGSALVYSTYIAGSVADYASSIAVDVAGDAYAAGYTASPDFPLAAAVQGAVSGGYDAFMLELNPAGNSLLFSTFYGGSGQDAANGIALDGLGNVYVAGQTVSSNFPIVGGVQPSILGSIEAFILKLSVGLPPDYSLGMSPSSQSVAAGANTSYTVTVTPSNGFSGTVSLGVSGLPSGVTGSFNPNTVAGSGSSTLTIDAGSGAAAGSDTVTATGTSGSLSNNASAGLSITGGSSGGPPSAVSVTPNTGSGTSQTFAFLYTDPNGAADIVSTQMDISATLVVSGACYFYYVRGTNAIYLASDTGVWQGPLTIGAAGTLTNSQCVINVGGSSASASGNNLTVEVALSFTAAYAGAKNIYMEVRNATVDAGWKNLGAWTAGTAPSPNYSLGMSPSSQSVAAGANTSYTVTVTPSNGFSGTVSLGVSGLPSGVTGSFNPNTVAGSGSSTLTIDAGSGAAAGSDTVTATGTSGSLSNNASAGLSITGGSSGGPPSAVSVTPNTGSGTSQTFAFLYTDPNGAADIVSTQMDISATLVVSGACYFYYVRGTNAIYLASDTGVWQGPLTIGAAGTLTNSQCVINVGGSSASASGNNLTVEVALSFTAAYAGAKNIYMEVRNATVDAGWKNLGAWTAGTAPSPNYSLGMSPSSQSVAAGANTSYTVTVTPSNGFSGTVSLGVSGLPSGVTGSFNPNTVAGSGSSTLTIDAGSGAAAGSDTVTATGTSGSLSNNASAGLSITGGSSGGPPSAVSVTPNTGSGTSQTFAFLYTDPNGAADIVSTQMDISATLVVSGACYFYYVRGTNAIYLASDTGVWQGPLTIGAAGTLTNSQCVINVGGSSASASGNNLTVEVALSFTAAYAGAKNIYMEVRNATVDAGWKNLGAWTAGTAPSPNYSLGMSPSSQSVAAGANTSYTVTVTPSNGFSGTVSLGVSGLPSGVTGSFNPNTVAGSGSSTLTIDAGSGAAAGSDTVTATGTSGSLSNNASAGLSITGGSSGGPPSAVSVTPNTGSGTSQTFAFLYTDPNGAADIVSTQMDISATLVVSGACYFYYVRGTNAIYLASDTGVWQGPLTIGAAGTLTNSQCVINVGGSSASASGNNLTVEVALSFTAAYAGAKNIYMEVRNATVDAGWKNLGAWTANASSGNSDTPPSPVSVVPNNGNSSSQTIAFEFTDPNGAADIASTQIDINATLVVSNACYLYFVHSTNGFYLASDAGVWQGPLTLGSSGILQNSQCSVNTGASSVTISGDNLTLSLALTFTPAFAGSKNIYMEAENATLTSGWVKLGAWIVP